MSDVNVINPAGDSFVFYATDTKDGQGQSQQDKSVKAMKFATELKWLTDLIAVQLEKKGFSKEGHGHYTGISITTGSLMYGDGAREEPLTNNAAGEVRTHIAAKMEARGYPSIPAQHRPRLLVVVGDTIDMAARLEALHKKRVGKSNIFVDKRFLQSLPLLQRRKFKKVGDMPLAHLGTETYEVFAMPEKKPRKGPKKAA